MGARTPRPDREDYDAADEEDTSWFPYVTVPYVGRPLWPGRASRDEPETVPEGRRPYETDEDEGTWLDEGFITLLLVAGVVLFVVPEPATSTLGIVLVAFGLFAWVVDWMTPEP